MKIAWTWSRSNQPRFGTSPLLLSDRLAAVHGARERDGQGVALIDMADRGPGFPADFLERPFDRFERAEAARTRDAGGAGLGLAITRAIVQAHGGRAAAGNRAGSGAFVRLELPLAPATQPVDVAPSAAG